MPTRKAKATAPLPAFVVEPRGSVATQVAEELAAEGWDTVGEGAWPDSAADEVWPADNQDQQAPQDEPEVLDVAEEQDEDWGEQWR